MKIFKLVNKDDKCPVSIFIKDESIGEYAISGIVLDVVSTSGDENEICEVMFTTNAYIKFDGCSHFNFFGEDFKNKKSSEVDSYYHLCGFNSVLSFIRDITFIWQLAINQIPNMDITEINNYNYFRVCSEVLEDYEVIEENIDENINSNLYNLLLEYVD